MQNSTQAANAWRILFLLFLANLFNFFDRTIPAIIIEPIRMEWHLSDFQLGIIGTAFTIVYAIAGLPLGRLADTGSRSKLMGWGLFAWSGLTAINGLVGSFWTFLLVRMGIGIGEASYAPAANSLIGDLFPAHRRARAMGIFMLGLPLGLLLAFFTIGWMVKAFDSWRAPFFIAAVPGLILAVFMFYIKEPKRGAAETVQVSQERVDRPIRRVLAVPTFLWLVLAGLCFNFATYACNSFLVPMLQRYFLMPLQDAAVATGVIVGLTGLVGLTLGGWIADKIHQRVANGRLLFAAFSLIISTVTTAWRCTPGASRLVCLWRCSAWAGCLPTTSTPACTQRSRTWSSRACGPRRWRCSSPACTCWAVAWGRSWWVACLITLPIRRCMRRGRSR
ncbi:MFS transporter [Pseudomonas allii]|uniref:MFS transporter n=1 Tax=Pseudomonas allii TaxID=2740531 RepID=UPI0031345A13